MQVNELVGWWKQRTAEGRKADEEVNMKEESKVRLLRGGQE